LVSLLGNIHLIVELNIGGGKTPIIGSSPNKKPDQVLVRYCGAHEEEKITLLFWFRNPLWTELRKRQAPTADRGSSFLLDSFIRITDYRIAQILSCHR
jgi:hypothetical protein